MSDIETVSTTAAPAAIGPYSQAVIGGGQVYCSGQIALDPMSGEIMANDVREQTHQVFRNLGAVLAEAEVDLSRVVKTTVYLSTMDDFPIVNEIYAEYFGDHRPARATVAAAGLPKGALVEIDCVALL
jgi:2-iminobutanoate/2-iminopropanoate deaminase